jgi:type IV pilus assembly protein PilB
MWLVLIRRSRKFRRFILEPYGMVLVTGPTDWKNFYAVRSPNEIRNDEDKIITIEDPVEYQLRGSLRFR